MEKELKRDLCNVRNELIVLLKKIKKKKVSLRKANTMIYCCSNITRTICAEMELNKT